MNPSVITRFAPSPTGLFHLGSYRTAIFSYLYARKQGGTFVLRIEDTDKARSTHEYEVGILDTLLWLGLEYDKQYRQSEEAPRHRALLEALIAKDQAYLSTETSSESGEERTVVRFRNPGTTISFTDVIRGSISMDTTDLGDFVIARSIYEPLFHFAVVADDARDGVTHVIRGEDHISNTPRQILIQQALGFPTPTYAHLPLVLGPDRAKLSKRRGARGVLEYRELGYLPEAILNYTALLGWHPSDDQEIFTKEELVEHFDLPRIQKGGAQFDETKLLWFNHEHIKRLSDEEFLSRLSEYLTKKNISTPGYLPKAAPLLKERSQTFADAAEALSQGEFRFFESATPTTQLLLIGTRGADAEVVKTHLLKVEDYLSNLSPEHFNREGVKEVVFPYATEAGRAAVLWPMRVALSGAEKSPDPFVLAELLGKELTLLRIAAAVRLL